MRRKFDLKRVKVKGQKIIADCPFCGHKSDFVLNPSGFYYCFCCRAQGFASQPENIKTDESTVVQFDDLVQVSSVPMALSYLRKRLIPESCFEMFYFSSKYGPRIVLPVVTNFEEVGYVSRSINDDEPKYLFSSSFQKNKALFRIDRFEKGSEIFVFENMFAALIHNGVCVFGKPSKSQIVLLKDYRCKLVYDNDAVMDAIQDALRLSNLGCEFVQVFEPQVPPDESKVLVLKEVLCYGN